jgi:hypothetical protein
MQTSACFIWPQRMPVLRLTEFFDLRFVSKSYSPQFFGSPVVSESCNPDFFESRIVSKPQSAMNPNPICVILASVT